MLQCNLIMLWLGRTFGRIAMRILCALFVVQLAACAVPTTATLSSSISIDDLTGHPLHPLRTDSSAANVLIFITTDCPISNSYAPEINRIVNEYQSRGIDFYLIHVDPSVTIETARKHAQSHEFQCPVIIDRKHRLVKAIGATVTPEVAVLIEPSDQTGSAGSELIYLGRIDNRYVDFGQRRFKASVHDLRDVLEAILDGSSIVQQRTKAVGCFIPAKS